MLTSQRESSESFSDAQRKASVNASPRNNAPACGSFYAYACACLQVLLGRFKEKEKEGREREMPERAGFIKQTVDSLCVCVCFLIHLCLHP